MVVAGCQDTVAEVVGEVESGCPPFVLSLLVPQQGSHNLECFAPEHLSTAIATLAAATAAAAATETSTETETAATADAQ